MNLKKFRGNRQGLPPVSALFFGTLISSFSALFLSFSAPPPDLVQASCFWEGCQACVFFRFGTIFFRFGTMFFRFGTIVFIVFIIRFIYWILIKFCHQLKF
jgi:hypothetical protein